MIAMSSEIDYTKTMLAAAFGNAGSSDLAPARSIT